MDLERHQIACVTILTLMKMEHAQSVHPHVKTAPTQQIAPVASMALEITYQTAHVMILSTMTTEYAQHVHPPV